MTKTIATPDLPTLKEMLDEFDSGKIPRSSTWKHLISGLYLNVEQVQEIEGWYNEIQGWHSATVDIKEIVDSSSR